MNIVYPNARVQMLVLTGEGELPTVPNPATLTPIDGAWRTTDIMLGEIAVNVTDGKVFTRVASGIVELGSGSSAEGAVVDRGEWDVDGGELPDEEDILKGYEYHITKTDKETAASINGVDLWDGMIIRAKVNDPGQDITNYYYR